MVATTALVCIIYRVIAVTTVVTQQREDRRIMMLQCKSHWVTPKRFYIECSECKTRYSSEIMTVWKDGKGDFEIPRFCPHCGTEKEIEDETRD